MSPECDEELEHTIARRDGEIVRLREEVQRLQLTLQEAQQSTANHISRLQQQLANKIENIERLKAKLDSQQDYEKIKEELRILKERKRTTQKSPLLSLSSPAPDRAVLDVQEEVLSQEPLAEHSAVSNASAVEIKKEVLEGSCSSSDSVDQLSKPAHSSCGLPESSRRTTPSPSLRPLSPHDAVPYLCIESNNSRTEGSLQVDASGAGETDLSASFRDGRTLNGNQLEGRFLEGIESQIETSEIAQRVKELLYRHKIGQRVFGQFVLDRLQGSVSEILAHPKPWSKLTTRGKEPFLRMLYFLSDEQNVLTLRIIQDRLRAELDPSSKIIGSSSPAIHSADMGSDDIIRNILEQAKKELQTQKGGNETKIQEEDQSRYTQKYAAHNDNGMGRGSEDIIKGILEQARHEMQVQQKEEDQTSGRAGDYLMVSDLQGRQEEEERYSLDQQPPEHDLLKAVSPTDFVQNIIRKVKSEIGAESTCSASSPLLPALSSTGSSSIAHLLFSDSNHDPSLSGKQDQVLSSSTKAELQGMKVSPGKDHTSYDVPDDLLLESCKENYQPSQTQEGESCAGVLSHSFPDFYNRLHTDQVMLQRPELDTLSIARRVKEVLAENNLGQRLFGEQVLGLTQGSVSDLLARPKPWTELSMRGREPFLRMYFWLKDPHNVECLKMMKSTGHRAHVKRPFTLLSAGSDDASRGALLDSIVEQFNMAKRPRVVLTSQEKEVLNRAFQLEPYPSHHSTQRLALQLGLQPSTVTNWFYNHRSRLRRTVQDGSSVTTDYSNSPLPDAEAATQHHFSDPSPRSDSSPPCTDTSLVTFKREPSHEVKEEEKDSSWNTKYVSTGVQSCRNMKLEEENETRGLSPRPEDGICCDKMVKADPDGTDHDQPHNNHLTQPRRTLQVYTPPHHCLRSSVSEMVL